ncbi:MAG: hypothetical protein WC527_04305 [Candidatus Margulisiibacteriota bacterium]
MAKPITYAVPVCVALTLLLLVGMVIGLLKSNALIIVLFLLPSVVYEAYRTEGKSTIWASWAMLAVILIEIVLVFFKINFNLAAFLGSEGQYVAGYFVPFGDIRVLFPTIMGVLSIILFVRTAGIYTRWLSVLIIIGSLAVIYTLDSAIFREILKIGIKQGLNNIHF